MTASRIFLSLWLAGCGSYRTNFIPMATKIPPADAPRERNLFRPIGRLRERYFAVAEASRQFPHSETAGQKPTRSGGTRLAQHAAQQFGRVARADLFHDAGAMAFN